MLKTRNWSDEDPEDSADPGIAIEVPDDRPELDDHIVRPETLDTPVVKAPQKRKSRGRDGRS